MSSRNESVVVPVAQEGVHVRKTVNEHVEVIDEPVLHDEVNIEYVVINRPVEAPEAPRQEGDVLVVPIYEEVITVKRQWILKEEVRFSRREVQTRHREEVTLRKEQVVIEPRGAGEEGST